MEEYIAAPTARANEQAQMSRRHVLLVNSDPAFLDLAHTLLQEARYNVTTTNAVPLTFALIAAGHPTLLIVDLALAEQNGWELLVRLHAEAVTTAIPVISTARDARLLDHAARYPYLFGGQTQLVIPFSMSTLLDTVCTLIG